MKESSKTLITIVISLLILSLVSIGSIYYKDTIYLFMRDTVLHKRENIKLKKNKYYRDYDFLFVQNTNDFIAKDKKHLLNIIYTILNSGSDKFEFYCDNSYDACISDIEDMFPESNLSYEINNSNNALLSNINNYVHPYNSFKKIYIRYNDYGEVIVTFDKTYSDKQIKEINTEIKKIEKEIINDKMTDKEKIKAVHDYIIYNAKYKETEDTSVAESNTAHNLLFNKESYCGGYADTMELFLEDLGIKSYKITSERHVWNLVYLDGNWYHLDTTWDDSITEDKRGRTAVLFFLITDERLKQLKVKNHDYDEKIYLELKKTNN